MKNKKGKQKFRLYKKRNQNKIFRNKNIRKKKLRKVFRSSVSENDNILGNDYYRVITHLKQKHFALKHMSYNRQVVQKIEIPEVFSISEDAESAIQLLRKTFTMCSDLKIKKIVFDHSNCKNLGLSASTIMDIIVLAIDAYREKQGEVIEFEGNLPRNRKARDILLASGLPYHLHAESEMHFDEKHVERFETIKGTHSVVANKADETATKLTLYFNKCLKTQNMELNDEGKRVLGRILGEVLSNCEIHGGNSSTWFTQGHYQIVEDNSYGEMQLLFMNLGETIYEGLKSKNTSLETRQKLLHIMKMQKKYIGSQWDEEMVYTVLALQEGISRLRTKEIGGYEGRGSGTVSMIEMFHDIGKSQSGLKPQMTIVSGSTQIRFSEQYMMQPVVFHQDEVFGTGEKQIIAFNDKNDIYLPANPENVKKMKQYFPGTVISLKFYLDSRYIISRKKER